MKHLKIKMMSIAFMAVTTSSMAQSLNKIELAERASTMGNKRWQNLSDGCSCKNRLLEDFPLWVHSG